MGIYQKITKLLDKKQNIDKEINSLQDSCEHKLKSIKYVREDVDSSQAVIRWVCNECSKVIGYPSNDEINNFFNK
jgi:peptidoglycan hydrolase CwlO-like protein